MLAVIALFFPAEIFGQQTVDVINVISIDTVAPTCEIPDTVPVTKDRSSWAPRPKVGPKGLRFAWGEEFGSTIDLSGHEMSSVDFNASAGISYDWINFAGIGVGANIMVANSSRTYPIYADIRTDFSQFVKLIFLDVRAGVALNYLEDDISQAGAYVSPSVGFNLASGTTFRSYITVGYTYISRKDVVRNDMTYHFTPLSMATVRLGIAF